MTLRLIPQPHTVQMGEGEYWLTYQSRITIDSACSEPAYEYARLLEKELEESAGLALIIDRRMSGFHPGIHLFLNASLKEKLGEQSYTIAIDSNGVVLTGGDDAGLFYAVQTLRQIIRQCGSLLPHLTIEDAPQLLVRGWFHDVTRGRIPTMEFMKQMVDRCSFYKINQMHLYIEHSFLFDGLSEMWRDDTPLTASDILELDAYCRSRQVELVPSIATFGHLYKLLRTKTCRHLSEFEEPDGTGFSFFRRMQHHTLNSTDEEALQLVCRMIDEYASLFTSKLFNINCDETFDLGKGRGKTRAEEVGSSTMYVEWVNKVCDHLRELGRRPMFWGDIIAAHPERIRELPQDIICMTWDYCLAPGDDNVRRLHENGAVQYLCPGVQGWNQTVNCFDVAYANIKKMAVFAHKFDGAGLLVTDWGDFGHFNHSEFALPGVIYAAAMGWNSQIPEEKELNADISVLEYSDRSTTLMDRLARLSRKSVMTWGDLVCFVEEVKYKVAEKGMEKFWADYGERITHRLPILHEREAIITSIQKELCELMPGMNPKDRERVTPYLIMADAMKLFNRVLAVLQKEYINHPDCMKVDPKVLASDLEIWYYHYRTLWRKVSRESELYRIGEVIFWVADYLRDLDEL
ncbi:MAG: beta-N-acetylhexosaminidase [Lachnospiraceae bacterium]|nr:beta-N-acetylhexosaminidase [Lachnospiraceae bacterium]